MTYGMWKIGAIGGLGGYYATPGQWQRRLWDESARQPTPTAPGGSCPLLAALGRARR